MKKLYDMEELERAAAANNVEAREQFSALLANALETVKREQAKEAQKLGQETDR